MCQEHGAQISPTHNAEPISRHRGVCPPVWLRKLDPDTRPAKVPGWVLRAVLNVDQSTHITNNDLYVQRPRLSKRAAARRMRSVGQRHKELPASRLVLWNQHMGVDEDVLG